MTYNFLDDLVELKYMSKIKFNKYNCQETVTWKVGCLDYPNYSMDVE